MIPKRIQRKRTKGWRMPDGAVYVGRPTAWGNPFTIGATYGTVGSVVTADNCLALFERYAKQYLYEQPHWLVPLHGKDLACWCPEGSPCHADILLKMANPVASRHTNDTNRK